MSHDSRDFLKVLKDLLAWIHLLTPRGELSTDRRLHYGVLVALGFRAVGLEKSTVTVVFVQRVLRYLFAAEEEISDFLRTYYWSWVTGVVLKKILFFRDPWDKCD